MKHFGKTGILTVLFLLVCLAGLFSQPVASGSSVPEAEFAVVYDGNASGPVSGLPDGQIFYPGGVNLLTTKVPQRGRYTFLGWSENPKATTPTYLPGQAYTGIDTTTLYAVWKKATDLGTVSGSFERKISYEIQCGCYSYKFKAGYTGTLELKSRRTSGGSDADMDIGIEIEENGNNVPNGSVINGALIYVVEGKTYYLQICPEWEGGKKLDTVLRIYPVEAVSYYLNEAGTSDELWYVQRYDSGMEIPSWTPTRRKFTFLGWSENPKATSATYHPGDTYTGKGGTTLYAIWRTAADLGSIGNSFEKWFTVKGNSAAVSYKFIPVQTGLYALSFDYDLPDGYASFDVDFEDYSGQNGSPEIKKGYLYEKNDVFMLYCAAGREYYLSIDSDFDIYADQYKFAIKLSLMPGIAYAANGSNVSDMPPDEPYFPGMKLPWTVPIRRGYTFLGWSENSDADTADYLPGSTYTGSGGTTLYAVWQMAADLGSIGSSFAKPLRFEIDYGCYSYRFRALRSGYFAFSFDLERDEECQQDVIVWIGEYSGSSESSWTVSYFYFEESADTLPMKLTAGREYDLLIVPELQRSSPLDTVLRVHQVISAPDFILPAAVTLVGRETFRNTNPTYVFIKDGIQDVTIEGYAFAGNPELRYVYIPSNVKHIDDDAFDGASCIIITPAGSYAEGWARQNHFEVRYSDPQE